MDGMPADDANVIPVARGTSPYRSLERLHPAMRRYVQAVARILDGGAPDAVPGLVEGEMRALLAERELLRPDQRASDPHAYRRHLIYADPRRRFTVLTTVWAPDQRTTIHGHKAWGAVGLYEGSLWSTGYRPGGPGVGPVERTGDSEIGPRRACSFNAGADGIRRLHNRSFRLAVSIHTYGMDLLDNPAAIHKVYGE